MTKKEFIEQLTLQNDIESKAAATRIVEEMITIITATVANGEVVVLSGLGQFTPSLQKGKTGLVPGTDKTYTTSDKMVPKFKAAKAFKDAVVSGK